LLFLPLVKVTFFFRVKNLFFSLCNWREFCLSSYYIFFFSFTSVFGSLNRTLILLRFVGFLWVVDFFPHSFGHDFARVADIQCGDVMQSESFWLDCVCLVGPF
jgi:hypothetical protein